MKQLIELHDWVEQQCKTGQPFTCADVLNKIEEILEKDTDIYREWKRTFGAI